MSANKLQTVMPNPKQNMSDENSSYKDALWRMYTEHCNHVRHHETQRSSVAGALIAIAAALVGLITFDKVINLSDMPETLLLIVLGFFGALFSAKQWERSAMHMDRARHYRNKLDDLLGGTMIKDLKAEADKAHNAKFRVLHRLRIHTFWIALYSFIALLGCYLAWIELFRPMSTS